MESAQVVEGSNAETQASSGERRDIAVVRDATFFRTIVDQAIVIPTPSYIEIACLLASSDIDKLVDFDEHQQVKLVAKMNEVGRFRLDWPQAVSLAMQILDVGIRRGQFNAEKIVDTIQGIVPAEGETGHGN